MYVVGKLQIKGVSSSSKIPRPYPAPWMMSSVPYVPPDTVKKVAATNGQRVSFAVRLVGEIARVGNWAGRDIVLNLLSRPPYRRPSRSHKKTRHEFAECRIRIFVADARTISFKRTIFFQSSVFEDVFSGKN